MTQDRDGTRSFSVPLSVIQAVSDALTAAREEGRSAGIEEAATEAASWQGLKGRAVEKKIRALADKEPIRWDGMSTGVNLAKPT